VRARPARPACQRGAALILFATVLVVGVTWYAVSALPKTVTLRLDREMKTSQALRTAKEALLGYAAQYAAQTEFDVPGRLPCPESTSAIGTSNEGLASGSCSNTTASVGRLPWRTLGMDQPRDGDGEPLWYVLSPGFRNAPVNFGTPGQLTLNGTSNAAVALIIAPGRAVNSLGQAGTPPTGCSAVNQQLDRYASPLDAAKFFECGNATGSYLTAGALPWSNDRVMAVTAAEWAGAISGAVAERLQRQFVPVLEDWRSSVSSSNWGVSFLPHASTFSDPATNDLCGDRVSGVGVTEGMIPAARATTSCTFWATPATLTKVGGNGTISTTPICSATSTAWRCVFSYRSGNLIVRMTATAPNVTGSFRGPITTSDVRVPVPFGTAFTTTNFSLSAPSSTGSVALSVDIGLPQRGTAVQHVIEINHLPEPGTWTEPSVQWFMQNNWDRYTYYAISPGARAVPGLACSAPGASGCITVNGLPSGSGNADDKRLVLALMGRPMGSQTAAALEAASHALPVPAGYTGVPAPFTVSRSLTTSNDRLAMCPYRYTAQSGSTLIPCN